MRRAAPAFDPATEGPDLTSMLDVVFILLIFFVVTATFVNELGVDLPQTPPPSTADASSEPPVRVLLEAGGAVRVDARLVTGGGVRPLLERVRAERPDAALVILAEAGSSAGALTGVLDAARLAGIGNVQLRRASTP